MATTIETPVGSRQSVDAPVVRPLISVIIIGLIAAGILLVVPRPDSISIQGWRMLAIFVCTIAAMMLRPIASGAAVLIAVVAIILGNVLTLPQALAGYGNPTVWLVLA